MTYRPILPRLINRLARHFGLDCIQFPEHVDLIVRVGQDGQRTELIRVTVDIDANHKLCGTWPLRELAWPLPELHLNDEVASDQEDSARNAIDIEAINLLKSDPESYFRKYRGRSA